MGPFLPRIPKNPGAGARFSSEENPSSTSDTSFLPRMPNIDGIQ